MPFSTCKVNVITFRQDQIGIKGQTSPMGHQKYRILANVEPCHRKIWGYSKEGANIFAKRHKLGPMFNRQCGDANISKLLQLVVNIVLV